MNFKFWKKEKPAPILEQRSNDSDIGTGFMSLLHGRASDYSFVKEQISAVYDAMEQISGSIAQLPIKVTNFDGEDVYDYPTKLIFYNNTVSKYNLMKQLIWDLYTHGNAYMLIKRDNTGSPIGLQYLEPNSVVKIYDNTKPENLYYLCPTVKQGKIEPINMIHIYKHGIFNQKNQSPSKFANQAIRLANETDMNAYQYFRSGCNVNGILKFLTTSTPTQRQELLSNWQSSVGGKRNGVAIVPNNVDYIKLGSDGSSAQLLESRQYNLQEIARYFNISPVMLGDLTHASYSTLEMVMQQFVTVTLQPIIVLIEEEFNRKLISKYESVRIGLDETFLIKYDKNTEANYFKGLVQSGIITINEARRKMGYSEIEGANKLILPYTDVAQNTINTDTNISEAKNE